MENSQPTIKEGYKQTDIGIIPEDWEVVDFGDVIDYTKGFAFKSNDYQSHGTRIIRVSDTTFDSINDENGIYIDDIKARAYKKWKIKTDDLIFSTVGSKPPMYDSMVGKVIIVEKKYNGSLLNQNAVLIRSKDGKSYKQRLILNHFRTKRYLRYIETIFRGNANQASITLADLFKFRIALPQLEQEQQAIAGVLSNVDALITSLDHLIIKKRNIKQGTMQLLLTGKKRLPGFKGDWITKELSEIGVFKKGKGIKKDSVLIYGLPCIRYGEIYTHHSEYVKKFYSYISLETAKASQKIKAGDLLFAGSGETAEEIGKCVAYLDNKEAYAGGDIIIFSPLENDSQYLGFLMNHQSVIKQKAQMAQGDAVVHIYSSNLAKISITFPPTIDEQKAIAEILSDMDSEIERLEQKRDKYKVVKQGMMQELLTGKTRLV